MAEPRTMESVSIRTDCASPVSTPAHVPLGGSAFDDRRVMNPARAAMVGTVEVRTGKAGSHTSVFKHTGMDDGE